MTPPFDHARNGAALLARASQSAAEMSRTNHESLRARAPERPALEAPPVASLVPKLREVEVPRPPEPTGPDFLYVEDVVIDVPGYEVSRAGERLSFTHQEFELLRFLVQNRGRVFTRRELITRVWGDRELVSLRTVDIHVYRLRAKLGEPFDLLIATVRRVGYKLCAERGAAEAMSRPRLAAASAEV